jgi:hypothetical protein
MTSKRSRRRAATATGKRFEVVRGPEAHPLIRVVGCVPLLALVWFSLRPGGAALATVIVVLSFALRRSLAMCGLVVVLAAAGAIAGQFPWWAGILLVLLNVLFIPLWASLPEFRRDVLQLDSPFGQAASGVLVRQAIRVAVPWLALLVIVSAHRWWPELLVMIPLFFLLQGKFGRAVLFGAALVLVFGGRVDWVEPLLLLLLVVPVFLASKGKFLPAVLWYTGLLLIRGLDGGVIALLSLAVAGLMAPVVSRRPRRHLPLPAPRYRHGFRIASRLKRADRAVGNGDAYRAHRLLSAASAAAGLSGHPDLCVRLALAALDDGRYQDASDAIDRASMPSPSCTRALTWLRAEILMALNRNAEAGDLLDGLLANQEILSRSEQVCYSLSLASALGAGQHARSAETATVVLSATSRRRWTLERARAYRLIAQADYARGRTKDALGQAELAHAALMANWWWQYLWNQAGDQSRLIRIAAGTSGRLVTENLRTEITYRSIQAEIPDKDTDFTLAEMGELSGILAVQGQWDLLADLLVLQARYAFRHKDGESGDGAPEERLLNALELVLRALRELDRNRYTLRSPRDRAAWSARLHDALAFALSLTAQSGDARMQAELIEFGRVQTLPFLSADCARSDQIALAVPPVIRVRGDARVSRYWDANRPPPADLEEAAAAVAGAGAWWLSYWQAGPLLYWSLVPPTGPVAGGRIDLSPASALRGALDALRAGLPVRLDGESLADMDERLGNSPLYADPAAERLTSARLAELLLPNALLTALWARLKTAAGPLPLAIVPSAALAFVPWSLLVLSDRGDPSTVRLVHAADWVLAPSASLATFSSRRHQAYGRFPLRLAIVDTYEGPGLEALPAARHQADALPPDVEVLGGPHWTGRTATLASIRAAVARLDPASTVLFACHALPARPDFTAPGGLVLAETGADGEPRLFTPADVLSMASDGVVMPAQALLLACDSSNLGSSAAGEWLTTAPAMLAAGSRTIVTTLFPIVDADGDDDPVLSAAISGQDLRAAIRGLQRAGARVWDSGGSARFQDTPLQWAAYAVVSAHQSIPGNTPHKVPDVSPRLRDTLYAAARDVSGMRGRTVHSGHLIANYLIGPKSMLYDSLSLDGIVAEVGFRLTNRLLRAERSTNAVGKLTPSKELLRALTVAQSVAARDGRDIEPEDVVRAALNAKSPARRLARIMTFARMQRIEQIQNLAEFTLAQGLLYQKSRTRAKKEVPEFAAFVDCIQAIMLSAVIEESRN